MRGIRVHYLVIWSGEEVSGSPVDEAVLVAEQPRDVLRGIVYHAGKLGGVGFPIHAIGLTNAAGERIDEGDIHGSVAGMGLLSLLPGVKLEPEPTQGRAGRFGLAAQLGLTGSSRLQLARHLALEIVRDHGRLGSEIPSERFQREDITALVRRFRYQDLGLDLFDVRNFGTGRGTPIPAHVEWKERTLQVSLDRGGVELDLDRIEAKDWSDELRRHSRRLDMTLAVRWRQQIDSAVDTVRERVCLEVEEALGELLSSHRWGQTLAEHVIEQIRKNLNERRLALLGPAGSLEEALAALDRSVARRPNALEVWLRTALWLGPALFVFAVILRSGYGDFRGALFPVILVAAGIAAGFFGTAVYLIRMRRMLRNARRLVIDHILSRQEAILSENGVDGLEEVLGILARKLNDAELRIAEDRAGLGAARSALEEQTSQELPGGFAFAPLLRHPNEYREALRASSPDVVGLVGRLETENALSPVDVSQESGQRYEDFLIRWCLARIAQKEDIRQLPFREVWAIHARHARLTDAAGALGQLQRRSSPLGKIDSRTLQERLFLPAGVDVPDVIETGDRAPEDSLPPIEHLELPFLCCVQTAYVPEGGD